MQQLERYTGIVQRCRLIFNFQLFVFQDSYPNKRVLPRMLFIYSSSCHMQGDVLRTIQYRNRILCCSLFKIAARVFRSTVVKNFMQMTVIRRMFQRTSIQLQILFAPVVSTIQFVSLYPTEFDVQYLQSDGEYFVEKENFAFR